MKRFLKTLNVLLGITIFILGLIILSTETAAFDNAETSVLFGTDHQLGAWSAAGGILGGILMFAFGITL